MKKMASQRFCLRWNNHQSNLLSVFDQLLHAETFTDVTLAVDGQYLKAHKMVLSACSPYFNALFVNHPEKHPIVILKDVPYSDMKSLLDFMYRGEVSVDQERLTAFLRVAESLRIKGLTEVNDDKPASGGGRNTTTPPPPQLHRIQPYLVQQRKQAQNMMNNNNSPSLLGSALSGPKRKRGRPRKLSGSSNGTGNDYDEFERENLVQGSPEMLEVKMGTEGYSEGSDDNNRESGDNDQEQDSPHEQMDTSESRNNNSKSKDTSRGKDNDNNTSVHINNTPELSQRLFGVATKINAVPPTVVPEIHDPATHLPTALGLRVRVHPMQQQQQQQPPTSLLHQQLRNDSLNNNNTLHADGGVSINQSLQSSNSGGGDMAALASSPPKPPSSNNLHQQFLMHIANNPIIKQDIFKGDCSPLRNSQNLDQSNDTPSDSGCSAALFSEQNSLKLDSTSSPSSASKPTQRRRIRRKAQSSIDDQAEHLTEMSVRGLDLFRYASISEGLYQCTECAKENVQKTFKNKYSFQRHAFLYHEGKHRKVFPCPVCGKEFSRPDKMKNHMKTTHECFVPKEVNYHPLNYLINAAAANEIQQMFPMDNNSSPANNESLPAPAVTTNNPPPPLIKLRNDIILKNEPICENSNSPPPTPTIINALNETTICPEEVKVE